MKRHTRHSREGFYSPKKRESTLPGLLYVASDTPETSDGNIAGNGYESGAEELRAIDDDKDGVNETKLLESGEKISTEDCGKACGKGRF